jgi:hypothetical protein
LLNPAPQVHAATSSITVTRYHFHRFKLSRIVLLRTGPAALAWTSRSAKSFLKRAERLVAQQWPPDGLPLRERGKAFSILWCRQELREMIDAIQQGAIRHQAIVLAPEMGRRAGPRPIGGGRGQLRLIAVRVG